MGATQWLSNGAQQMALVAHFVCGLPLLAFAVATLRRPTTWKAFALLCVALQAALHATTSWWFPHYGAPAAGAWLLLGAFGLREASARRWRGRRLGPWLPAAVLAVQLPLTLIEVGAQRPDVNDWSRDRQRIEAELLARREPALVVVDDRLRAVNEWVYNCAALERCPILWIQDLGAPVAREVAAAYAPRRLWRLTPDGPDGEPRLESLPPEAP